MRGSRAGCDGPRQLAAGDDVEAASQTRQQVQQRKVGVGFHRVANEVRRIAEGTVELPVRVFQRGARVDEAGRAEAGGNVGKRNALGGKHAAAIVERCHGFRSPGTGAGATGGAAGGGADAAGGDDTGAGISGVASGAV